MSFLDLYQGDQDQAARMQPNEGTRLPSTFDENFHAAFNDGQLFSQSIARANSRAAVLGDYIDEIKQKTGNDLSKEFIPDVAGGGQTGVTDFDAANERVAKLKQDYPDLDLAPLSEDEIDKRAVAKAQAAHRTYETLQAGEKTFGGKAGSFLGSTASAAADPINIVGLAIAPETGGASILGSALRWGALAGVSQATIEAASDTFKEQVQPGYMESGAPLREIGGAFVGGAVLGGTTKALGNAWTRVKTGAWPTSVRDAGNVIESEANVASTNPFPGVEGEVAHREALTKTVDDILAGRPVDISAQITPEMAAHFDAYHGSPYDFEKFDVSKIGEGEGAQSFGHGLYFAENQKTAEAYQENLGGQGATGRIQYANGKYHIVDDFGASVGPFETKAEAEAAKQPGRLYKVKITADKERMLDWDKPISEQPQVQQILEQRGIPISEGMTGGDAYHAISDHAGSSGPGFSPSVEQKRIMASQTLSDAGIPGIKYLDQGSRDAAEGTRNFVVFNDKDVQITHKNGKPVNADIRQNVVDQAAGLPPKQPELPLETPDLRGRERARRRGDEAPQPPLQTAKEMSDTLTAPDHQDAIRADIDRERAMGDFKVPSTDENGNHTMVGVDGAMAEVDAYKKLADDIQACASPPAAEAAE